MIANNATHIDLVLRASKRLLTKSGAANRLRSLQIVPSSEPFKGWTWMALPDWASDLVPDGKAGFYVPAQNGVKNWVDYDWWRGAYMLLTSAAERGFEDHNGPVHSYSYKLSADSYPAFEHAWVNRIVLFLRRWWAKEYGQDEGEVFGPLPTALVHLTHDVDAVSKTFAIRIKQTAFCLYNHRFNAAMRFMFGAADYWQFDTITNLEESYGHRSLWNFYGGKGGWLRSPKEQLMDPFYYIGSKRLKQQIRALASQGHVIGVHPRFDTWCNTTDLLGEKQTIEDTLGTKITSIRQHWLRFSFAKTWKSQKAAGFAFDFTLGFNDRPGFRNSAALEFTDEDSGMRVVPMVLMDSHLYDYCDAKEDERFAMIDRILDELVTTGGEASVIWHQRVFHPDYGWGATYEYLLDGMKIRNIASRKE